MNGWFCREYPYRIEARVRSRLRACARMLPTGCRMDFGEALRRHGAGEAALDVGSIVVVGYDGAGEPLIFDPEKRGLRQFCVPWRFDADYDGFALPQREGGGDRGTLTWLIRDGSVRSFGIYFDCLRSGSRKRSLDQSHRPLIGDAERIFAGRPGRMMFAVRAGAPLIKDIDSDGRQELIVATECWRERGEGILCFRDVGSNPERPLWREIGLLRDEDGNAISYLPRMLCGCAIGDIDGDGLEDIVGQPFGPETTNYVPSNYLVWYKNVGEPDRWKLRYQGKIRRPDGRPLRIAPGRRAFHVGDLNGDGRNETLVVSARNVDMLVRRGRGFELVPLRDESRQSIGWTSDALVPCAGMVDIDGDGRLDLVLVNSNNDRYPERRELREGRGDYSDTSLIWYRNLGGKPVPRLKFEGLLKIDGVPGGGVPPGENSGTFVFGIGVAPQSSRLFVCSSEACISEVHQYDIRRSRGAAELRSRGPLRGYSAIEPQQCNSVMADFDGDGKRELLCGHMSGRLQFLRNIGTRLDPVFSAPEWVRDERGKVIRVCESTDPYGEFHTNECRAFPFDMNGDGLPDLVWGSGWGRVHYLENLGAKGRGAPRFRNHGPLKDTAGRDVDVLDRCVPHIVRGFFGDGKLHLVVGGCFSSFWGHTGLSTDPAADPDVVALTRRMLGRGPDEACRVEELFSAASGRIPSVFNPFRRKGHVRISAVKAYEILGLDERGVPRLAPPVCFDLSGILPNGRAYPLLTDWDGDGRLELIHRDRIYRLDVSRERLKLRFWKRIPFGSLLREKRLAGLFVGNEGTSICRLDDGTDALLLSDEPFSLYAVRRNLLGNVAKVGVVRSGRKDN